MESPSVYIPIDRRLALAANYSLPEHATGAALFADISGFTPLTEALAEELGRRRGAEELTRYLNLVYNALIGQLHLYGGSVISFSGDAITCWLDRDDGRRAVACGLKMQAAMEQFAEIQTLSGRKISLAMKAAAVAGSVRRFVVGDPGHVLVDVMAGHTLDILAEAEHMAGRGDVIVDQSTAEVLGDLLAISEWREDESTGQRFGIVQDLVGEVHETPWPDIDEIHLAKISGGWLLPAVLQRLEKGQGEFLAELRPAVALFLRFSGIDYDGDEEAPDKLNNFIRLVEEILARYEGSLLQLTLGDKGSYLYAAFGAPIAHEDDAARAAATALEIQRTAAQVDYLEPLQIGITSGRMRTGAYGSDRRRTYGVLGDSVNLSARLMTAAKPGEILVDEAAHGEACEGFRWESKPAIMVKGKTAPISLWSLIDRKQHAASRLKEPQYSLPMVGRTKELALIGEKMDTALAGRGQIVGIAAEAGMGKSRLAAEVIRLAGQKMFAGYAGECQSYGTNTGYLVWRDIWSDLFNLAPGIKTDDIVEHLTGELQNIDQSLVRRVPLLGTLLNIPIPENELTSSLDAKIRKVSLESMLVTCLRVKARDGPIFIVLEDCHWLDPLSSDLIEVIGRALIDLPVFMLIVYRQLGSEVTQAPRIIKLPYFTEIALTEFSLDEASALIKLKLAQIFGEASAVPPHLLHQITERAAGNPFYIEELLNLLNDRGIDPNDRQALLEIDLPSSLYSLILTRIDQLTERQNSTLKVASVIGRLFQAAMVWGVYPELGGPEQVKSYLDSLSTLDLTPLDAPEPELLYLFKHVVIQEVAYESLLYSTRSMLHERIGDHIEVNNVGQLDQVINLLAHHYGRSENTKKKSEYVIKAGYVAKAIYDNEAAIRFFQQVLPLLSTIEKLKIYKDLGAVLEIVGRWVEAYEIYQSALQLANEADDDHGMATFHFAIADLVLKQANYEEAEKNLSLARKGFEEHDDQGGVAQTSAVYGNMAFRKGDFEEARRKWEESLAIRRELGDKEKVAGMLGNMGILARHEKDFDLAKSLQEEGLQITRELDDPYAIARALNNLSILNKSQGDIPEAKAKLEEAVGLFREVGDQWMLGVATDNLGVINNEQGKFEEGRKLMEEAILIFRDLDDKRMLAYMLEDFARLEVKEGEFKKALKLIGAAESVRKENKLPLSELEVEELSESMEPARRNTNPTTQQAAEVAGRKMTLEQAVGYALNRQ